MDKNEVTRRCVGCGGNKPKSELIRVSASGEELRIDKTGSAPGRGAYICKSKACLDRTIKKKGLERSLKRRVDRAVYEALSEVMEEFEE